MPDDVPDLLESLPPELRTRVAQLLARLPVGWTPQAVRHDAAGWVIAFHDAAGDFAAELAFFGEPPPGDYKYSAR